MKHINKILNILAAVLVLMSVSCEGDKNGPLPDEGMREGAMAYVTFQETSSELVDVNNPDAFHLDYTVGVLWEPDYEKIQLVVVYTDASDAEYPNGDYAKQYVLVDNITTVPVDGTVTMAQIVAAVAELGSSADIAEGDAFHFFPVVHLKNGDIMRTYDRIGDLQRVRMVGTGLIDALAAVEGVVNPDVNCPVPCAFNVADYVGVKTCVDTWWPGTFPVTMAQDMDYTGDGVGLIIVDGLAEGFQTDPVKIEVIMKNLTIDMPQQTWFTGNFYGYGNSWISGFGVVNTCAKQLEITIPGWRVAAGSFGGGNLTIF
jgi:hypothetical protein